MSPRIFIIDDEADILEILSIILEDEGYNVVTFDNSEAADHVLDHCADLILLDVRIMGSVKDGIQICNELKAGQSTRHLPVVLISAERDLHLMAKACHADDYIRKPFDISDLLACVQRLLAPR